jgi:hypothetical protein
MGRWEMFVEAEGILGVLAALVDCVRECAVHALWWERLRMTSEFMLIGGQNLGACIVETASMLREYGYGLCMIERNSGNAHDTHRHVNLTNLKLEKIMNLH